MSAQSVTKKINLLPKDRLQSGLIGKLLNWAIHVGRYVVVFTELIVIGAFLYRFGLDRQLTDLNEKIQQEKIVVVAYEELEGNFRRLQDQLKLIKEQGEMGLEMEKVLANISQITPIDATYSKINVGKKVVLLEGEVLSDVGLATLLNEAQKNDYFEEINLESVSSPEEGSQAISFRLSLDLTNKQEGRK